jgi:hypothetical protein
MEELARLAMVAKEYGRSNRDEDMDFFAVYYKEKFACLKFIEFKRIRSHP